MNISLAPEVIFIIGTFPFTNTLLVSWVIVAFLTISAIILNKKITAVPRGFQNLVETIKEEALSFIFRVQPMDPEKLIQQIVYNDYYQCEFHYMHGL